MNNKYTIKKFNIKFNRFSTPKTSNERIKINEQNNLINDDNIVLSTILILSDFSIKNLKITSIVILKKII
jgi:hypothetical protein